MIIFENRTSRFQLSEHFLLNIRYLWQAVENIQVIDSSDLYNIQNSTWGLEKRKYISCVKRQDISHPFKTLTRQNGLYVERNTRNNCHVIDHP